METAGFHEPAQRLALGGVYNHLLLFGMLGPATDNSENKPIGPVSRQTESFVALIFSHLLF